MRLARGFAFLFISLLVLVLAADTADARSSRYRGDSRGPQRLVDRDNKDDKDSKDNRKKDDQPAAPKAAPKAAPAKKPPAVATAPAAPKPGVPRPAQAPKKAPAKKDDDAREQEAQKLRDQADKEFDKGTEEGLLAGAKLLRQVLDGFDGTDAAASAQQQLDLLLSDEKLGPMILLAEAQEEFDAMHYRKARNKYKALLARFPKTEQGAEAKAKLAEIDANDLVRKSVYTDEELEDARLWLLSGNIHLENGRKPEAAAAYRRVIEEYPGCRFALMAEEKLPAARGS